MPADPNASPSTDSPIAPWQRHLHEIIFEADTRGGKAFDVVLLLAIVASVVCALLESVADIRQDWGGTLRLAEWVFTILFTIEYVVRLMCVGRPLRYALSFFGVVDLLAIIPTYLSVLVVGSQSLIVIRSLRLVRVFRIFKLPHFLAEAQVLADALRTTGKRIAVFLLIIMVVIVIVGSAMYIVEGNQADTDFTSIPKGIYWAIVTMTTVGYGDITPTTHLGQTLAAIAMLLGYSIIIVPTGIFSAELIYARQAHISTQACEQCGLDGHDVDARHCKHCGSIL
ncbi:MAG: potassium channel family protein [Planctomycetota bacterium]|jgi:voltage-gated potassium channel